MSEIVILYDGQKTRSENARIIRIIALILAHIYEIIELNKGKIEINFAGDKLSATLTKQL